MAKKVYLWVDDERNHPFKGFTPPQGVMYITTRSYQATVDFLGYCRDEHIEVLIDLDHDLGEEKTGYDICKFIIENEYPLLGFILHTMNPVGRQNMNQLLIHYGYTPF